MMKIDCHELGFKDCDWHASGETPAGVVEEAVAHLRQKHDLDMPDPEIILEGKVDDDPLLTTATEPVRLVVERLKGKLDLVPAEEPSFEIDPLRVQVTQNNTTT
jgi:predicted small metal-binding protein